MKSFSRYLVPAAGLLAALPAARADDPHDTEKKEMRVVVEGNGPSPHNRRFMHEAGPQEMESVTFLGVETHPADATLAEQLNLARGTGLVVRMIAPESPAAAALRKNDILVKLDDQLLIEQRQLAVLIRNHREGDDVTITYIRGGKEGTARVKLAKHEVPKMALMDEPFFHARNLPFFEEGSLPGMDRED
ncbi:MAG: htrA, partial [Verrucomicrobia bacterium]|nr:htrA [Verrucomicrobiota bacterium]